MFARVTRVQGSPHRNDDAVRHARETVIPQVGLLRGYKGMYYLLDPDSGKGMLMTLWETREDLDAAAGAAEQWGTDAANTAGASSKPEIDAYEVVLQP